MLTNDGEFLKYSLLILAKRRGSVCLFALFITLTFENYEWYFFLKKFWF